MEVGCFTDVMLNSLTNYHQEHAIELRWLPKDVAAACGAVIRRFNEVSNLYNMLWVTVGLEPWTRDFGKLNHITDIC